ncbi:MAG: hypothetical protein METHAR1v1_830002 [Methanothrix sp.]|nr:MAG: hypothetical protein METHAR1v1_830002 [Methanothrix sp.]
MAAPAIPTRAIQATNKIASSLLVVLPPIQLIDKLQRSHPDGFSSPAKEPAKISPCLTGYIALAA